MLIEQSLGSILPLSLDIISFSAILSGILVIVAKNPVISILFLIALFVNIAAYLILIGINFIGLAYITVYVGAIAILFLFVIFLLDIKLAELHLDNVSSNNNLPIGTIIGIGFLYPIYSIIPNNITEMKTLTYYIFNNLNTLITGSTNTIELTEKITIGDNNIVIQNMEVESLFINFWDGNLNSFSQITSIGNIMYSSFTIWFFVASLILLLAMIAAISLTFKPSNH